ncbi:MAG: hypothetical protein AAF657_11000 [Acidobacteriota bacterium]
MISLIEAWRRHVWLWVLPLAFCILNLLAFAVYGSAFAGKVERLERQYQDTIGVRDGLREEHAIVVEFLAKADAHRGETEGLYWDYFQTEAQRFTRIILEVKRLARQAGLPASTWSYPKKDLASYGLVERSVRFSVDGTYDQLRQFINFLELTDHFLVLNSITLGGSGDQQRNPRLNINLVVSTMFAKDDLENPNESPAEEFAEDSGEEPAEDPAEEPST